MTTSSKDPSAFLKMLDERTSVRSQPAESEPTTPVKAADSRTRKGAPRLSGILPHCEDVVSEGGVCVRVSARAPTTGKRSAEGYACPVAPFAHHGTSEALALLGRNDAWREITRERIAYVDIETTGLQGGSGTVAFLIGVGRFEGDQFCVRQYFMEDFHHEPAMIRAVADDLANADALVSFNGKSFDLPIMEMRWRLARREPAFPKLHLDLLHLSRRLWSGRLPDCRLGTVERHILSLVRYSDAPSAEIPQLYFDYVRGIRPDRMSRVLDHHAQDIFSLAAVTQALARAVAEPTDSRFRHASDQAGLARLFQSAGESQSALAALRRAIDAAEDEDSAFRLSMLLARALKRRREADEAVAVWKRWSEAATVNRLEPLIELAKDAEHRLKDHAAAERWTRRALDLVMINDELAEWIGQGSRPDPSTGPDNRELHRRLKRIQLKASRAEKNIPR